MKKILGILLAALLLASAAGLSLAEGAFDVTVFEASPYYHFDRFDNAWSVEATYTAADAASNSRLTFSFGTNSTMVAWKQPFMFRIAFQSSGIAQTATALSVYLDDVRYDFSNLQDLGGYAVINSGSVLRDMLNSLKNARTISYRVYFDSKNFTAESGPESFSDLIAVADLFEKANAWSIFTDTTSLEALDQSNNATRTPPIGETPAAPAQEAALAAPDAPAEQAAPESAFAGMTEEELRALAEAYATELAARKAGRAATDAEHTDEELTALINACLAELQARKLAIADTLGAMEDEALTALYRQVVGRLTIRQMGDIVYDEDGITVSWIGLDKQNKRLSFVCQNTTGTDFYLDLTAQALNSVNVYVYDNSKRKESLPNGMSVASATLDNYSWLLGDMNGTAIKTLGLTHLYQVDLELSFYEDASAREPVRVIRVGFPVDLEIAQ